MTTSSKRYVLAMDIKRCIGCRACNVSCRAENKVPLGNNRNWLNEEYRGEWPKLTAPFEPEQCHHCAEPACVRVCPTGASMQRSDGVVVVDEPDCVGCRYCIIACPYDARFFRDDLGVVGKCDFCSRRLSHGQEPACVDTCPGKVRIFGDINDPSSKVAQLVKSRPYRVKKAGAGTEPQIYYLL